MEEEPTANSLQCDICQVQLRNTAAAQIHAEKTDHQSFSESTTVIKPLTEEEKKAKLQELRERLAAKRKAEAEVELENQKKNAVIERKKNQESSEVVEALQRKEELKAIAARKKEKEDDLKAKQRVRAQLEQDKIERAERAAREKALRAGQPLPPQANTSVAATSAPKQAVERTHARLQIRHERGKPIVQSYEKTTPLLQVLEGIHDQTGIAPENAVLKTFGKVIRSDMLAMTVEQLGLAPSASLTLSST